MIRVFTNDAPGERHAPRPGNRPFHEGPAFGRGPEKAARAGFTLMELLVATTLTVFVLGAVTVMVGILGRTVNESRAMLEMTDRVRSVTARLQNDLEGITVTMAPPVDPGRNEGYFKYIEGPNPLFSSSANVAADPPPGVWPHAANTDQRDAAGMPMPDTTVIDHNDILMFTTRSKDKPFAGRAFMLLPNWNGNLADIAKFTRRQAESPVAEVSWFIRGRTLYRRVLLVLPDFDADLTSPSHEPALPSNALASIEGHPAGTNFSFYQFYDLSVRRHNNGTPNLLTDDYLIPNSLGDLTKPENRFAHQSPQVASSVTEWAYPFHPHVSLLRPTTLSTRATAWRWLGLPTLKETAHPRWGAQGGTAYPSNAGAPLPMLDLTIGGSSIMTGSASSILAAWMSNPYDLQVAPHPFEQQNSQSGHLMTATFDATTDPGNLVPPRTRADEDIVLENVVGFDVKAWDPEAPVLQYTDPGPGGGITVLEPGDRGYPASNDPEWTKILAGSSSLYAIVSRGAYVDLNYGPTPTMSHFSGSPDAKLALGSLNPGGTYDTWSTHYEADGIDNNRDTFIDPGTDGFDTVTANGIAGIVDDAGEKEAPPPYAVPLRGLKVTIRAYEPFSRKIREVTITQDFSVK